MYLESRNLSIPNSVDLASCQEDGKELSVVSEHVAKTLSAMKQKVRSIQENVRPVSETSGGSQVH